MGQYKSVCAAIDVMEAIRRSLKQESRDGISTVIRDLQGIARDVRYGGEWDGDYEGLAEALDACRGRKCYQCTYKGRTECMYDLKSDAAAAIRQLDAEVRKNYGNRGKG